MPRHLLSDVDVVAISIVDKGANRKKFYLRKNDAEEFDLPASNRIVKTEDWSAVYCVVAEPGWEERPGQGAQDPDVMDVWKSADEIRMAAHKFMRNGALVNKMHETFDPFGNVVENFIAPADFRIDQELIKAGSWVVAIEPSVEGRAKIESGEFSGVSIQGSGTRTLEKAEQGNDGTLEVTVTTEEKTRFTKFFEWLSGEEVEREEPVKKGEEEVADALTAEQVQETVEKAVDTKLEKTNKDLSDLAQSVAQIAQTLAEGTTKDEKDPAEEVYHRLDDVAKSLDDIRDDVEKLAKGSSTQVETTETSNGNVKKSDNPLAGLLS